MTYAYAQVPLHLLTAKHCNFQIIGGESTGTYRFVTSFYGLSVMPTEFQKLLYLLQAKFREVFVFIDDFLIVTKGTKKEHLNKAREVLKTLDNAELQVKAEKCKIAQSEIEWLSFKMTNERISPVNAKVQGITEKLRPESLKELRSFLGAVNQFNKFIPDLASICFPFRSILKKDAKWNCTPEHEKAFLQVYTEVQKVANLTHFKRNKPLRIICDESKQGLGAVLQQQCEENEWKPISYPSRVLTELKANYSIIELELLAVVWSVEHFKKYGYGVPFGIVSDHKALQSVLKSNKDNKTYSSRLTRWVDRLSPFDFSIVHTPGRTLGMVDYLSRHPSEYEDASIQAEKQFKDWVTVNVVKDVTPKMRGLVNRREPIKLRGGENSERKNVNRVLTVHAPTQTNKGSDVIAKPSNNELMALNAKMSVSRICDVHIQANAEDDRVIRKVIKRVNNRNNAVIARLPPPGREKFNSFSVNAAGLLYIDNRLVIPKT